MSPREANADLLAEITALRDRMAALTRENAELHGALAQGSHREEATSEILRVISSSPTGVRPVFEAIATSATTLCEADFTGLFRFDGNLIHFEAQHGWSPEEIAASQSAFPQRPGRGSVTARAILAAAIVQVADVSEDPDVVGSLRAFRTVLSVPMIHAGRPVGAPSRSRGERSGHSATSRSRSSEPSPSRRSLPSRT